jgi:hypothetical protein
MSTLSSVETLWVVLDGEGRVVIICSGADARDVAEDWRGRGYRTVPLDAVDFEAD